MNLVLIGILDVFITTFVNNILVYNETLEEYKEYIKEVLKRLREARL